jgi:pyrrolysine biosynthesis protein PylC
MRLGIVGGGLQGLEAAYLARRAGWETRLLDRRAEVPARGLADSFAQGDAGDPAVLDRELRGVDLLLPALEDTPVLQTIAAWAGRRGVPLAFDPAAYAVSSSKRASNRLFRSLGMALPRPWPECGLPVLVKPDGLSGSRGVRVFREPASWRCWLAAHAEDGEGWIAQEYLEGPSYSIEVLGTPGAHRPLQVTALDMDADYDCKRVRAPAPLSAELTRGMERLAAGLAGALGLRGLMDLEVILHDGRLKLLEIDARLPSQTPIAVFWSTGYNLVEALGGLARDPQGAGPPPLPPAAGWRAAVLEHLHVTANRLEVCGEHVLARRGSLRVERDFFGAEEAITDRVPGRSDWVATLLCSGRDAAQVWSRRCDAVEAIRRAHGLADYEDPEPSP